MSRRTATDPAAALVRAFDRLVADDSTPVRRIEQLADQIVKARGYEGAFTPPPPPAPKPKPQPSGPKVTLTRQHLCSHISPDSDFRGTLSWFDSDDRSQPCTGCGMTAWRP